MAAPSAPRSRVGSASAALRLLLLGGLALLAGCDSQEPQLPTPVPPPAPAAQQAAPAKHHPFVVVIDDSGSMKGFANAGNDAWSRFVNQAFILTMQDIAAEAREAKLCRLSTLAGDGNVACGPFKACDCGEAILPDWYTASNTLGMEGVARLARSMPMVMLVTDGVPSCATNSCGQSTADEAFKELLSGSPGPDGQPRHNVSVALLPLPFRGQYEYDARQWPDRAHVQAFLDDPESLLCPGSQPTILMEGGQSSRVQYLGGYCGPAVLWMVLAGTASPEVLLERAHAIGRRMREDMKNYPESDELRVLPVVPPVVAREVEQTPVALSAAQGDLAVGQQQGEVLHLNFEALFEDQAVELGYAIDLSGAVTTSVACDVRWHFEAAPGMTPDDIARIKPSLNAANKAAERVSGAGAGGLTLPYEVLERIDAKAHPLEVLVKASVVPTQSVLPHDGALGWSFPRQTELLGSGAIEPISLFRDDDTVEPYRVWSLERRISEAAERAVSQGAESAGVFEARLCIQKPKGAPCLRAKVK